jgi:hypothetical protein
MDDSVDIFRFIFAFFLFYYCELNREMLRGCYYYFYYFLLLTGNTFETMDGWEMEHAKIC